MTKTLTKEHRYGLFTQPNPNEWSIGEGTTGWEQPFAPIAGFFSKTYFDLAGLSLDEKTLFFQGATSTSMWNPLTQNSAAGDSCQIINLMSTVPLTDLELARFFDYGNFADVFGNTNGITYDQTIYARLQEFTTDLDTANWGKMVMVSDRQIGSLEPTASDRIYSYVMVEVEGALTSIRIYPHRHILRATATEEPEYQYLMRLKRSYELQNEPDRD